jgi:membrane-bound lytic murein transglycosylase A
MSWWHAARRLPAATGMTGRRAALAALASRGGAMALAMLLASCGTAPPQSAQSAHGPSAGDLPPGSAQRLTRMSWQDIAGWNDDPMLGVTAALRQSCARLGQAPNWKRVCTAAAQIDELDPSAAREFFERNFTPFQLSNSDGSIDGLVTGYYEPLLRGSRIRRAPYLYALYRWPPHYRKNAPLPARSQLVRGGALRGAELVYVDDPIEAFFLQVQGSGRILMDDGNVMRLAYGGTNGQPYKSIGRWLLDHGELTPAQATMQGIKAWAKANPARVDQLLDVNPRFVFFSEAPGPGVAPSLAGDGPLGALGVPLTPERSIAVDPQSIPLGMPVFLSTTRPLSNEPLNRVVFAQDVGTAIRGGVRADYFWGLGDQAGDLAGKMKQSGRMWLLLPNS